MKPSVRQYEIQPREINLSWLKKVVLFFAVSFFMFGFRWVIERFLHDKHQPILEALIMPVVVGAGVLIGRLTVGFCRAAGT